MAVMHRYQSFDEWTRDVAKPASMQHMVTRDGKLLDTQKKALAHLRKIGALNEDDTDRA